MPIAVGELRSQRRCILKSLILLEKPGWFAKSCKRKRRISVENAKQRPQECVWKCVGEFGWRLRLKTLKAALEIAFSAEARSTSQPRAWAGVEIQLKIFNWWGTIEITQKSSQRESGDEKSLTQLQRHCGRSNQQAIDSYQPLRCKFSILRVYFPKKWYLMLFLGYCWKNDQPHPSSLW